MAPPKGPCPTERIADDARGNNGGGVGGEGRKDYEVVDLREVDCYIVSIKYEVNGRGLPPVSPRESTRYSHTIAGGRRGEKGDKEDVSG